MTASALDYQNETWISLMDVYLKTREAGFGAETKRRIMLGTFALSAGYYDAYYLKSAESAHVDPPGF